jgi:hypothetical protein
VSDGPHRLPADEPPPFGGSWGALYAVVIVALAASIAVLAWLTGHWR